MVCFSVFLSALLHQHLGLCLKSTKGLIQGFGVLTLCGCVTVMAVGYRAQGQGGSKEMYFYSYFQGTVLMSQERCKPLSNKSPSPSQEAQSPLSPQKIVSWVSSNFFDTKGKRPTNIICLWALGQKRTEEHWCSLWSI